MALPKEKKEYLLSVGLSEEIVKGIEDNLDKAAKVAQELGIERKEASTQTETPEQKQEKAAVEAETPAATEVKEEEKSLPAGITAEDIAAVITETMTPFVSRIESLETLVKELGDSVRQAPELSPAMTTAQVIASMVSKNLSAVGSKEASIARNNVLAKESPAQTDPKAAEQNENGFLGSVIARIIT